MKKKVLITGASGRIGRMLTSELADQYDFRLTDVKPLEETHGFDFVQADLADMAAIRPLCQNIDTVIHLGADPRTTAPWETLLPSNIIGTYNVLQSAHEANCRRVIYASSINAVAGYPQELQIRTDMPVRPPNLYGATKAWGEAVGRYYADELGLSCFCLRFGWVLPCDSDRIQPDQDLLDILLTYDDLARLMVDCLEAPDFVQFGIFHVLSNNRRNRLDISETRRILGYEPQDDGFALAEAKKAAKTDD